VSVPRDPHRVLRDFAVTLLQKETVNATVWEIAKGAVAQFGFEDCVVYLLDDERNCLIQVAAHGPKNPRNHTILDPLEIDLGQGIVGAAAASGMSQLVPDTRVDTRYIVDLAPKLSELAVPMIYGDCVIGVVDSENQQLGYFDQSSRELLECVAAMAASRIVALQTINRLNETVHRLQEAETELSTRAEELRAARDRAEEASRVKGRFVARMSHELRTPLTSILGFTEQLRRNNHRAMTPQDRHSLDTIDRNGSHLLRLVDDLLDHARLESGRLRIQESSTSVSEVLNDLSQMFHREEADHGFRLQLLLEEGVPEFLWTDPLRLRQILINLIGNAFKHAPIGLGAIRVRVGIEPGGDMLQFEVRDPGPGLSESDLQRAFEDFEQLDRDQVEARGGAGLGLPISRRLAQLLGGELSYHSDFHGSTFRLTIPVPVQQPVPTVAEASPQQPCVEPGPPSRILVADDSPDIRLLVQHCLQRAGHEVVLASNGQEALETWVQSRDFGLVLMDMQMPVLDGYRATQALRREGCTVPIVAFTAHAMSEEAARCREVGCSDYLTKPFEAKVLVELIGRLAQEPV